MPDSREPDMKSLKEELDQILEKVNDQDLPLDQALDYYERAVKLGMKATELMEARISEGREEAAPDAQPEQGGE